MCSFQFYSGFFYYYYYFSNEFYFFIFAFPPLCDWSFFEFEQHKFSKYMLKCIHIYFLCSLFSFILLQFTNTFNREWVKNNSVCVCVSVYLYCCVWRLVFLVYRMFFVLFHCIGVMECNVVRKRIMVFSGLNVWTCLKNMN